MEGNEKLKHRVIKLIRILVLGWFLKKIFQMNVIFVWIKALCNKEWQIDHQIYHDPHWIGRMFGMRILSEGCTRIEFEVIYHYLWIRNLPQLLFVRKTKQVKKKQGKEILVCWEPIKKCFPILGCGICMTEFE